MYPTRTSHPTKTKLADSADDDAVLETDSGVITTDSDDYRIEHWMRDTNSVALHTVEVGPPEGDTVILLHGFPEFWHGWKHQTPFLVRRGYRVVVPDQRGYHLEELAKDIVGLVEGLGQDKVFVVGHDWGTYPVQEKEIYHYDRIRHKDVWQGLGS